MSDTGQRITASGDKALMIANVLNFCQNKSQLKIKSHYIFYFVVASVWSVSVESQRLPTSILFVFSAEHLGHQGTENIASFLALLLKT